MNYQMKPMVPKYSDGRSSAGQYFPVVISVLLVLGGIASIQSGIWANGYRHARTANLQNNSKSGVNNDGSNSGSRLTPHIVSPLTIILDDATKHAADDAIHLRSICELLQTASGVRPHGIKNSLEEPTATLPDSPDWYMWAQLNLPRSSVTCSSSNSTTELVQTYAVHGESGGAVCISNSSAATTPYLLKLKLPRGVFRIEKLCFIPCAPPADATPETGLSTISHAIVSKRWNSSLIRLEGSDNNSAVTLSKQGELAAGELDIIRFTEVARASRVAIMDVKESLHALGASTPQPAAKLRRVMSECDKLMGGVTAGTTTTGPRRLSAIHRIILLIAQAQALQRNNQARQTVKADVGAVTMASLERASDSLAETSAVITGLVPQVDIGPFTPGVGAGATKMEAKVTVAVRNTGQRSVDSVKLGLDASEMPAGAVCSPDDPAFFGAVHPGQTVRATFKISVPSAVEITPARFVADVSYFTAGAPAHLRPRPW